MKILSLVLTMMSFAAPLSAVAGQNIVTPMLGKACDHPVQFEAAARKVNLQNILPTVNGKNTMRATSAEVPST